MSVLHQIPTESKIRTDLKKILFGKRLFCPHCSSRSIKKYNNRYRCKVCRKPFSLTSVTWLKGMKLPLQTFWLLLWCWTKKVPLDQTVEVSGVSKVTVRRWFSRFREHIPREEMESVRLEGIVQMDEAYRGGKKNGYAIIGAKQKKVEGKQRKMVLQLIDKPSVDRRDALEFIYQCVRPHSLLHTDGSSIYKGIENWWSLSHTCEYHSKWEFALTSEIEGLWGNLTTFVRRMYHHVTRDKMPSILIEFTSRQMFPEWFLNPESFLSVSMKPLLRTQREPGRPKKEKRQPKTAIETMPVLVKHLSYVPS